MRAGRDGTSKKSVAKEKLGVKKRRETTQQSESGEQRASATDNERKGKETRGRAYDVCVGLAERGVALLLSGERAGEVHLSGRLVLGDERQHDGGRQLVVRAAPVLADLHDVDGVPRALHRLPLLALVLRLLDQDARGEPAVDLPAVDGRHAALVVPARRVGVCWLAHLVAPSCEEGIRRKTECWRTAKDTPAPNKEQIENR